MALPRARRVPASPSTTVLYGRGVIEAEARTLELVARRLDATFERAVDLVVACRGRTAVSGMGKAGFVAQKLSATLASTGSPSLYVHPAEALHGDLGRILRDDLLVALSNSGETDEVVKLAQAVKRLGVKVIALTGDGKSRLARMADVVLDLGPVAEACPLGLAPTASTAALMAVGDALAMSALRRRPFDERDYAALHPAGKLGRRLVTVAEVMRVGRANPVLRATASLREAAAVMTKTPGRPGAACIVNAAGVLVGIFTDGDLRRLVERGETDFARAVSTAMAKKPRTVSPRQRALDAAELMREAQIDQVPVVDERGRAVGLLDVQDLLAAGVVG